MQYNQLAERTRIKLLVVVKQPLSDWLNTRDLVHLQLYGRDLMTGGRNAYNFEYFESPLAGAVFPYMLIRSDDYRECRLGSAQQCRSRLTHNRCLPTTTVALQTYRERLIDEYSEALWQSLRSFANRVCVQIERTCALLTRISYCFAVNFRTPMLADA